MTTGLMSELSCSAQAALVSCQAPVLLTGASRHGPATLAASGSEHAVRATHSAVNTAAPANADAENLQGEVGNEQACWSAN